MLYPQVIHRELTLVTGVPQSVTLEGLLSVDYLLLPRANLWNTSSYSVVITSNIVTYNVDNVDIFTKTLQSGVTVATGVMQPLTLFADNVLVANDSYPYMRHALILLYTAGVGHPNSVDVRLVITGMFDESNNSNLLVMRNIG